jgi:acyl-CoA synthetase (AMP-forming)/AMP-acid ligase II
LRPAHGLPVLVSRRNAHELRRPPAQQRQRVSATDGALSEKHDGVTFREMLDLASQAQRLFRRCEVKPGVPVVMAASPGPEMFAALCGLLGLGAPIVLIEPWMPWTASIM